MKRLRNRVDSAYPSSTAGNEATAPKVSSSPSCCSGFDCPAVCTERKAGPPAGKPRADSGHRIHPYMIVHSKSRAAADGNVVEDLSRRYRSPAEIDVLYLRVAQEFIETLFLADAALLGAAMFFVTAVGLGPLPGSLALAVHSLGMHSHCGARDSGTRRNAFRPRAAHAGSRNFS